MGSLLRADGFGFAAAGTSGSSSGIPALSPARVRDERTFRRQFQRPDLRRCAPGVQAADSRETAASLALNALPFQFPHSIVTMVQGSMPWLVLGSAFLSASLLGNEFTWGTIRNVGAESGRTASATSLHDSLPWRLAPADIRLGHGHGRARARGPPCRPGRSVRAF